MFCPKCGQPQVSDEVRFCSRCGFSLNLVAELLAGENLPARFELESQEKLSLYQQITSRIGAKIIFASIIFIPFAVLLGIPFDTAAFLLISVILFLVGFTQVTYSLIFGEKAPLETHLKQTRYLNSSPLNSNLPTSQTAPVPLLEIRQRETNEIIPPPSVTDHTTKLLELEEESSDSKI